MYRYFSVFRLYHHPVFVPGLRDTWLRQAPLCNKRDDHHMVLVICYFQCTMLKNMNREVFLCQDNYRVLFVH